jgi:Fur family ferric uptake transcriptional regulator
MTAETHKHAHAPRLTKGAKKVLEALERVHELTTAQDIHSQLRLDDAEEAPGLTTVYRALESLVTLGLVQAVVLGDGERRYELVTPGEHHHHLVCEKCRGSVHLDKCLVEELESTILKKYGFEVRSHVLEMFGLCSNCQKKR